MLKSKLQFVRTWLQENKGPADTIAWLTFAISLTMLVVLMVLACFIAAPTLLIGAGLGVFSSLLVFSLGLLLVPQHRLVHAPAYEEREQAQKLLQQIIQSAGGSPKTTLCVMGVAAADFLAKEGPIKHCFLNAVDESKIRARFILLNPDSQAASLRHEFESARVATKEMITACVRFLDKLTRQSDGRVEYTLHDHYGCFLCFNHLDMVFHPYFVSATGSETPLLEFHCDHRAYKIGKEHFDKVWKYETAKKAERQ